MMEWPGSGASGATIAGIGTIIADHVFVAGPDGHYRYRASRGGGTVWNILAHLARLGFSTEAHGAYAPDGCGTEAVRELEFLGIDAARLVAQPDKHSLVFTQWLNDDIRHGPAIPQDNFTLDCPVCQRPPVPGMAPEFKAELFAPGHLGAGLSLMCTDRLTAITVATAALARAAGYGTALDLGGVAGLSNADRRQLIDRAAEFDVVAMPAAVADWLMDGEASDFSAHLFSKRTSALALTQGRDGFKLFLRTGCGSVAIRTSAAPEVETVVDASGAGDAFIAAMIGETVRRATRAEGRLGFRAEDCDVIVETLRTYPVSVLGGVGARAGFPECPDHTGWGNRLAALRGSALDDLRRRYGDLRPCYFCDRK